MSLAIEVEFKSDGRRVRGRVDGYVQRGQETLAVVVVIKQRIDGEFAWIPRPWVVTVNIKDMSVVGLG